MFLTSELIPALSKVVGNSEGVGVVGVEFPEGLRGLKPKSFSGEGGRGYGYILQQYIYSLSIQEQFCTPLIVAVTIWS